MKQKRNRAKRVEKNPVKRIEPFTPDTAVLNLMQKNGADLSKERLVHFYLYFPDKENARAAEAELKKSGYEVDCSKGSEKWLCLASRKIIPSNTALTSLRKKFEALANQLSGLYDGWETELDME